MCGASVAQQWEIIGEMPYPVAGGAAVVHDSKIFVLGGYSDFTQNPVDYIQMYDPINGTWELVNHMNEARYGLSACVIEDNIFYFGGIRDSSDYIRSLESFETLTPSSVSVALQNDSFNRSFASSIVDGNSLFIFGGEPYFEADSVELPYVSVFNLSTFDTTEEYDTLFSSKELAHHQMITKVGERVFLFGGVSNSIEDRIYIFDIPSRKFTRATIDMILPRASGVAVYLKDYSKIYLIGGLDEVEPALDAVEVYDLESETSTINQMGYLNIARSEPMAVEFQGKIYVMGGKDFQGNVVSEIEIFPASVTSVEDQINPGDFVLDQNYPNPFNPVTTIKYSLPEASFTQVIVYNSIGEETIKLVNEIKSPGNYTVKWNGETSSGNIAPSGVYFYKLITKNNTIVKKMTLLK